MNTGRDVTAKVLTETWWGSEDNGTAIVVHGGDVIFYAADDADADRARIAACAPEALRLLLEAEWGSTANMGPSCGYCNQPQWNGHVPDCRWVLLMKKARSSDE